MFKKLFYLKEVIDELTQENIQAKLYIDNQSAIILIKNEMMNRSKHIAIKIIQL